MLHQHGAFARHAIPPSNVSVPGWGGADTAAPDPWTLPDDAPAEPPAVPWWAVAAGLVTAAVVGFLVGAVL